MRIAITPDLRLYVDIEGCGLVPDGPRMRDKPTLLLLHGGPGYDHSGFKPLLSPLADVAQIVYYDHRGHGRSDRCPPEQWTLDNFADDVVRLCDALGIVKPVVLGQSFGGFVAQRYLARHHGHPRRSSCRARRITWGCRASWRCSSGLRAPRRATQRRLSGQRRGPTPGRGTSRSACLTTTGYDR